MVSPQLPMSVSVMWGGLVTFAMFLIAPKVAASAIALMAKFANATTDTSLLRP